MSTVERELTTHREILRALRMPGTTVEAYFSALDRDLRLQKSEMIAVVSESAREHGMDQPMPTAWDRDIQLVMLYGSMVSFR